MPPLNAPSLRLRITSARQAAWKMICALQSAGRVRHSVRAVAVNPKAFIPIPARRAEDFPPYHHRWLRYFSPFAWLAYFAVYLPPRTTRTTRKSIRWFACARFLPQKLGFPRAKRFSRWEFKGFRRESKRRLRDFMRCLREVVARRRVFIWPRLVSASCQWEMEGFPWELSLRPWETSPCRW
jgi:hypothetical protein